MQVRELLASSAAVKQQVGLALGSTSKGSTSGEGNDSNTEDTSSTLDFEKLTDEIYDCAAIASDSAKAAWAGKKAAEDSFLALSMCVSTPLFFQKAVLIRAHTARKISGTNTVTMKQQGSNIDLFSSAGKLSFDTMASIPVSTSLLFCTCILIASFTKLHELITGDVGAFGARTIDRACAFIAQQLTLRTGCDDARQMLINVVDGVLQSRKTKAATATHESLLTGIDEEIRWYATHCSLTLYS